MSAPVPFARLEAPLARTTAEIVAERFRAIDEFVAQYGMDYWETHTEPPAADTTVQLTLEERAAA